MTLVRTSFVLQAIWSLFIFADLTFFQDKCLSNLEFDFFEKLECMLYNIAPTTTPLNFKALS